MSPQRIAERLALSCYAKLLLAYPAEFRSRFGQEMLAAFEEMGRDKLTVHPAGAVTFLGREFLGLLSTATRERLRSVRSVGLSTEAVRRRALTLAAPAGVFAIVLSGYTLTLAPTVTFWDAGEFLAASSTLGVPHPPGTPLFVFVSNAWATLFPVGGFAFRVNFMTAVFSAGAAALWFSVVLSVLRPHGTVLAYGAAMAAALVSAFSFTVWQNSNESEVYMLAAFTIAAVARLSVSWRHHRGGARSGNVLLLIVYLAAVSIGNHLLALLAGPAVVVFMWHTLRTQPLKDPTARRAEWGQWAVVATAWVTLIGTGLGSTTLFKVAAVGFLCAVWFAARTGGWRFPGAVTLVATMGVTTYLFLYIRSGFQPFLNEGNPSTWEALLSVLRREQYPPRLPTDNPLYLSGPDNPGRTIALVWLQIQNYIQYFDWQWSNGLATAKSYLAATRLPFTLAFMTLGLYGASELRRRDASAFWLVVCIFLVTGPGLVAYMNFKPGFSVGYDAYPNALHHEVRERDYFFVVSFQVWGVLAGIGIAALCRLVQRFFERTLRTRHLATALAMPVFALALAPAVLNSPAADRARGPATHLARDLAYDFLQTVEPYGIVFTAGDNDTFPLWYLQAVEGIRRDVTVVVFPLSNTDWFIRHLRDKPVERFDPDQAPWFAGLAPSEPPPPLLSWSDRDIESARPFVLPEDLRFTAGVIDTVYPEGTALYVQDILTLRLIQENVGRRPIYLSTSAGSGGASWERLGDSLVQEGLAFKLYANRRPDVTRLAPGLYGPPLDLPRTDSLVETVYRYADLRGGDLSRLNATQRRMTNLLAMQYASLGRAHLAVGNIERGTETLDEAYRLAPTPQLRRWIENVGTRRLFADTPLGPGE